MRIIVCYVVSYKHAVALYTPPVVFDRYFLIEHTENTYEISTIWSTCSWDSVYHYLITYCVPAIQHHSPTLYAQYLLFLFLEIIQLFWNYSLCCQVPIIPEIYASIFCASITAELWTSRPKGKLKLLTTWR